MSPLLKLLVTGLFLLLLVAVGTEVAALHPGGAPALAAPRPALVRKAAPASAPVKTVRLVPRTPRPAGARLLARKRKKPVALQALPQR